jgi:magnesium chelatase family protein
MDRIDIHVEVPPLSHHELRSEPGISSSATIRTRVAKARRVQSERFDGTKIYCNAQMGNRHIRKYCLIDLSSSTLLETAMDRLGLSARAFNRILKISRTIADLDGKTDIGADHVAEAIQYRSLDRKRLFL